MLKTNKNQKIILAIFTIFIFSVFIFNGLNFRGGINKINVKAAATDNVAGFAWSENIGWISFNCTNSTPPCSATNYGVKLDLGTGNLSGYAFSENIGWISFSETGCPAGTCQPRLVGNDFLGWARALNNGGGWDGWISLNCANSGACAKNYKVSLSGSDFTGYGWGGDIVGWISFNGTPAANYKVYISNASPAANNLSITPPTVANLCGSSGAAYAFQWIFSDPSDTESKFQMQIDNNSDFLTPTVDRTFSGLSNPDGSSNDQQAILTSAADAPGADKLSYSATYYWRVQVWDSSGASSDWTYPVSASFTTPVHVYPTADFICSPSSTSCPSTHGQFEPISFTDKSVCYDNSNNSVACSSRSWSFGDGSPVSAEQNPKHTYTAQSATPYNLKLTITDVNGNFCSKEQGINIGASKPKWKEVLPK